MRDLLVRLALEPGRAFRRETPSALFGPEAEPVGSGDLAAARQALAQAEALIQATANGFRAARALYRRAEILRQEGETAQAQELFLKTIHHPACERHIRDRATAMLNPLGSSPGRP